VALAGALGRVPDLKQILQASGAPALGLLAERLDDVNGLMARVRQTLIENPPLQMTEGGLVKDGFSADVDELRELARGGKEYLVQLQQRETERTGISSLKIGFNRVFGYYLEITNTHRDLVPDDYIRKQTLKNAERYITPELKEYEAKVLSAEEKLKDLEYKIVAELRDAAAQEATRMLATAAAVAELDVFTSLAKVAVSRRYVRPTFVEESAVLDIQGGRHPVVEAVLSDDPFVPNDTHFSADARLSVLTGPNMSGKSTYLRQTALVVLMAQMGAFVPADSATLGLVDRIFTRLGGGDDISRGASTFMVEMVETANILRNATEHSLLLLDEVGRGTSTFDGLAIAWAVCEHVHDQVNARCLFATHYHQLTDLALHLPRARNLNVAVREWGEEIVFLHRIEEGGTDRSYGIHVARLAGLPSKVLARARAVLARLEKDEEGISERILAAHEAQQPLEKGAVTPPPADAFQMGLFDRLDNADAELAAELQALNLNEVTPIAAWQWLERIRKALN
jgi:DNA mismatch repair protein MutS